MHISKAGQDMDVLEGRKDLQREHRLDSLVLEAFSSLNYSVILYKVTHFLQYCYIRTH